MSEWICIGKIVNTHGIKGELRILSDFDKKEKVFQPQFTIYIGIEKRKEVISSYRPHKKFDMICYEGITNINEVLQDIGKLVFIRRSDLHLNKKEYLLEDLKNCQIIENEKKFGKVEDIIYNKAGILLVIKTQDEKLFYLPKNDYFIKKIDINLKKIEVQNIQGLML